ncbi:hypothetical protein [Vibrio coralliirubri]|uniref:hypothetical protein n=1 Tax=Vibrio coralliirubri TaxID=1516159 RepID=UPI0006312CFF|nr:hypothetical protein [Vibrio coralliirubri]CDT29302.1 conserved exported hypothetical protein [Vibrio coralliirubri]
MKLITLLIIFSASLFSLNSFADTANGGASGGQTLGPEIKCTLPNGVVQSLPPLYCKIFDGKAM